MAASSPFRADFLVYRARFITLGDWSYGCTPIDDKTLMITAHDSVCILRETCNPSTMINQLNILPRHFTFRTEDDPLPEVEEMKRKRIMSVIRKNNVEFDPAVTGDPMWMPLQVRNIHKAYISKMKYSKQIIVAIMHKHHSVRLYQYDSDREHLKLIACLADDMQSFAEKENISSEKSDDTSLANECSPIQVSWIMANSPGSVEIKYLTVIMKNRSLMIWQVKFDSNTTEVTFHKKIPSFHSRPSSLHYHNLTKTSGVLFIGYLDGSIEMREIHVSDELTIGNPVYLWEHKDKLEVNCIMDGCLNNEVVICKENHLFQCQIDSVDSFEPLILLHRFDSSIKGIDVCSGRIMASANDLSTVIIDGARKDVFMLTDTRNEIASSQCHGITLSKNAAYCVLLTNPSGRKHEKMFKSPFEAQYVLLKTSEELMSSLKLAIGRKESKFSDYYDVLECLRKHVVDIKTFPHKLLQWSQAEPHTEYKLKLTRFLLKLRCCLGTEVKSGDLESWKQEVNKCEEKILIMYLNKQQKRFPEMNNANSCAGYWLAKKAGRKTGKPPIESCAICDAQIQMESGMSSVCVNRHAFLRCCQTLLTCGEVKHPRCINCGHPCVNVTSSLPDLVQKLRSDCCTYCDGDVS